MYPLVPSGLRADLPARDADPWALIPCGAYITDGISLFRVLSHVFPRFGEAAVNLEDCLTLDVCTYTVDEIHRADMRKVRQAEALA